jgi:hypothetical protein
MWFARHFPGLYLDPARLDELPPEQTLAMHKVGQKMLDGECRERLEHTKGIMRASSAGRMRF